MQIYQLTSLFTSDGIVKFRLKDEKHFHFWRKSIFGTLKVVKVEKIEMYLFQSHIKFEVIALSFWHAIYLSNSDVIVSILILNNIFNNKRFNFK